MAAQLTMNREGIRRLAAETLGLATSPYRYGGAVIHGFVLYVRDVRMMVGSCALRVCSL